MAVNPGKKSRSPRRSAGVRTRSEESGARLDERALLLRAARRVFLRRGYAQTRVEDILREAGISTRAFYRAHDSKDELFLALFEQASAAAMARLRASVARHASPPAQIEAYVDASLELAYDPALECETRLFADVPAGLSERHATEVLACRTQLVTVLREIIERGRASGDFRHAAPEIDAWVLHGALAAGLDLSLRGSPRPDRRLLARRLGRLLNAALATG